MKRLIFLLTLATILSSTSALPAQCLTSRPQCSTFYAGVEATYLAPLYDVAPSSFQLAGAAAAPISLGSTFDTAELLTAAPRISFGWQRQSGFGIQARYWELSSQAAQQGFPAPIVGNQLQELGGIDSFNAYAIDLELTKQFRQGDWDLLGTFGVRHASIDHDRTASAYGAINGDVFNLSTINSEEFHGTGLTFSLSGLKCLRPCSGLSAYWNTRGSTVFGSAETSAIAISNFSGPFGTAGSVNGAIDQQDETMFIGEAGAGLQWSKCVDSFNGRAFARAGVEFQYWDTNDGSAIAQAASGTFGNSVGVTNAVGGELETHLIGFSVMTGFAF